MFFRIEAPHFVAGGEAVRKMSAPSYVVTHTAPIIRWAEGKYIEKLRDYCQKKGWTLLFFYDDGEQEI